MADMDYYDTDLLDDPKPVPVSDDVYAERVEIYNQIVPIYKDRLRKAFGTKEARDVDKSVKSFLKRDAYGDMENDDWSVILRVILETHCSAVIVNKIRFTPKKYRHEWTVEELEKLVDDCEIDEQGRKWIFNMAQKYCPYLADAIAATGA
ncbi:MAG: hypothetical protein LUH14_08190 [Clostridiaceae bacterium]|nr:hypothetical protein [Clostridiaceae bacterium]